MKFKTKAAVIKRHISWWWQVVNTFLIGVGSTFVFLILVSNTFSASAQAVFNDCHDIWLAAWLLLKRHFSDEFLMAYLPHLSHLVPFWIMSGAFLYADVRGLENMKQYKIQDGTNEVFDYKDLKKAFRVVISNQILSSIFAYFWSWMMDPTIVASEKLPTFNQALREMFVFIIIEEILFYYFHRLSHHKRIYKYIHKRHHEWTTPIALVSTYAHPIEHIFVNMFPVVIGPMICGSHLVTTCMWVAFATINAVLSHCGYHLPYMTSPEAHDFHHLTFTECFGVLGVLDYLHSTDIKFRLSRQYQLHKTFFNDTYSQLRIRKVIRKKSDELEEKYSNSACGFK